MPVRRIAILTGSEPRHHFMRLALSLDDRLDTVVSVCEGPELSLSKRAAHLDDPHGLVARHIEQWQKTERDFVAPFIRHCPDRTPPILVSKGRVNEPDVVERVVMAAPELIACFGSSILGRDWIDAFPNRILNVHLGLSPYYRGSGTNFWALADGRPELAGATFMILDAGIDTGRILHQFRARILSGDDSHQIGARVVTDAAHVYADLLVAFGGPIAIASFADHPRRLCRRRDFDAAAVHKLQHLLDSGLIDNYLQCSVERTARFPIMRHPKLCRCN